MDRNDDVTTVMAGPGTFQGGMSALVSEALTRLLHLEFRCLFLIPLPSPCPTHYRLGEHFEIPQLP